MQSTCTGNDHFLHVLIDFILYFTFCVFNGGLYYRNLVLSYTAILLNLFKYILIGSKENLEYFLKFECLKKFVELLMDTNFAVN